MQFSDNSQRFQGNELIEAAPLESRMNDKNGDFTNITTIFPLDKDLLAVDLLKPININDFFLFVFIEAHVLFHPR